MAASSMVAFDSASRRRLPRYAIDVALDVITLQSGVPNSMPGRCTDLSEAGLGAVVAGELIPGQAVAIELRLPNVGLPVRARAKVRYQERLRYGIQFVGFTVEQREKIRYWSSQHTPLPVLAEVRQVEIPIPVSSSQSPVPEKKTRIHGVHVRRRRFVVLLALIIGLAALGWWRWQKAWNDLETDASVAVETQPGALPRVAPEIMDNRILYKEEPVYPDAARRAGMQGLVILDAVIAPDGTVKRLRPVAGTEILTQSALNAVQSWRYKPYRVNGRGVEIGTTISVDFRLR
jgi:TonB family protein